MADQAETLRVLAYQRRVAGMVTDAVLADRRERVEFGKLAISIILDETAEDGDALWLRVDVRGVRSSLGDRIRRAVEDWLDTLDGQDELRRRTETDPAADADCRRFHARREP